MSDIFTTYKKPDPNPGINFLIGCPDWYWEEYYKALGLLIHNFAKVEDLLNLLIYNQVDELVYPKNMLERRSERTAGRMSFSGKRKPTSIRNGEPRSKLR